MSDVGSIQDRAQARKSKMYCFCQSQNNYMYSNSKQESSTDVTVRPDLASLSCSPPNAPLEHLACHPKFITRSSPAAPTLRLDNSCCRAQSPIGAFQILHRRCDIPPIYLVFVSVCAVHDLSSSLEIHLKTHLILHTFTSDALSKSHFALIPPPLPECPDIIPHLTLNTQPVHLLLELLFLLTQPLFRDTRATE